MAALTILRVMTMKNTHLKNNYLIQAILNYPITIGFYLAMSILIPILVFLYILNIYFSITIMIILFIIFSILFFIEIKEYTIFYIDNNDIIFHNINIIFKTEINNIEKFSFDEKKYLLYKRYNYIIQINNEKIKSFIDEKTHKEFIQLHTR